MKKISLTVILSLASLVVAMAQSDYRFRHYGSLSGLSHNTVLSLFQDRKGFIWVGTKNGLNRFDGSEFKIYLRNEAPGGLCNSIVNSIAEDTDGQLWVATDNGLSVYDPTRDAFHGLDVSTADGRKVGGYVRMVQSDGAGRMWILSGGGLFLYESPAVSGVEAPRLKLVNSLLRNLTSRNPTCIFLDSLSNAYLGFHGVGIVKYNAKTDQSQLLASSDLIATAISSYDDQRLIVGTRDGGAYLISRRGSSPEPVELGNGNVYVRCIEHDADGRVWIGSEEGAFILDSRHDRSAPEVTHIVKDPTDTSSLSDNAIYSLLRDNAGGMWLGSYFGGIDFMPDRRNKFVTYHPQYNRNSVTGQRVRDFVEDREGFIWIGTEDNGLCRYDPSSGRFEPATTASDTDLSHVNIQCLTLIGDTKLWIGTYTQGIFVYDISTRHVRHYDNLSNNDVFAIYADSRGNIWVGSSTCCYTYDEKSNSFSYFEPLGICFVSDILEDSEQNIWFTSYNHGVMRYNCTTKEVRNFTYNPSDEASICYDRVTCGYLDSSGTLWFASEDGGMCRYNRQTENFTRLTTADGLPSNAVYKILEDDSHMLWVSTSNGLAVVNPETMKVTSLYGIQSGLQAKQFNYNSGILLENGRMLFGSIDGFMAFDPRSFSQRSMPRKVVLTGLYVYNQLVSAGESPQTLDKAISYASRISLKHDQETFTLSFSTLDYESEGRGMFAYKLEEFDKQWNYVSDANRISYHSIPSGSYRFCIRYMTDLSDESGPLTCIDIRISPPWWQSIWAYVAYLLAGLAVGYAVFHSVLRHKNRVAREKKEEEERLRKEELYQSKIEFFTSIAHEIRTPVTLIKAPLEYIMTQHPDPESTRENLQTIERNSERLQVLVNQLLDFRKVEAKSFKLSMHVLDVRELTRKTVERFEPTARLRNLRVTLSLPDEPLMACIDEEATTKILSNLLSNAIKYAETYVSLSLKVDGKTGMFVFTEHNDGALIPEDMRERIFEAFVQVRNEHVSRQGSGIGLALALSLAQLQGGRIYLDTHAADNCFVVELPVNTPVPQNADASAGETAPEPGALARNADENKRQRSPLPTVMVVEDDAELQQFLVRLFSGKYNILAVNNGAEAMDLLRSEIINLVISDIMMPEMDGLELCRTLKADIETCHIPIILLTAKTTLTNKIEGLESGADAYIEKPFSTGHLSAQVENLLESRRKLRENFANDPFVATKTIAHDKADEEFLGRLTSIIRQRLEDEEFDVDRLAAEMNMSRSSLHRKIKAIADQTPNDFIRIIRLKRAAELLQDGRYRVNEVCMMVGIRSMSYFSKAFYRQFGKLPKDFMK
ncbi:MAG: response regulator [Prevotella sp.]|nr:response regulator [Prevotella sp.]